MTIERRDVLDAIHEAKASVDMATVRDDIKLTEQGMDSLEMFNVLLVLSEKLNINIPDADVDKLNTINAIIDYLNRRLA